jgi:hypothetical protein
VARDFDWLTHEILGDIDEIAPPVHQKPVPCIPVLDEPLLSKAGHAADSLCAQLETDQLISELCPLPEAAADTDRFVKEFEKATQPDFVQHVLDLGAERMKRKAAIRAGDQRRSKEVSAIVSDWADDYAIGPNPALERVKRSMAALTNDLVMEAAL